MNNWENTKSKNVMKPDKVMIEVLDLIKANLFLEAKKIVTFKYPRLSSTIGLKLLNHETELLGFNISPVNCKGTTSVNLSEKLRRKSFTVVERLAVFSRDFYQCRYSGIKLFAPPVLTLLSLYLEETFPCVKIPHFPLADNHQGLYTLYPSPDHINPISREGNNSIKNLITCSSALNMVKSNRTNYEMGWEIIDLKNLDEKWDGGMQWYKQVIENEGELSKLINKASEFKTFHSKINPLRYFLSWYDALLLSQHNVMKQSNSLINLDFTQTDVVVKPISVEFVDKNHGFQSDLNVMIHQNNQIHLSYPVYNKSKKKDEYFLRLIEDSGTEKEVLIDIFRYLVIGNFLQYKCLRGYNAKPLLDQHLPSKNTLPDFKIKSEKYNGLGMIVYNLKQLKQSNNTIIAGNIVKALMQANFQKPQFRYDKEYFDDWYSYLK